MYLPEGSTDYVVQGHRYDVYENIGCLPNTYETPLAIVLVQVWPLVIGLISLVYCSQYYLLAYFLLFPLTN